MKASHNKPGKKILFSVGLFLSSILLYSQEDIDVGQTGWDVKRPVMAAACECGCPWGELGDFVQEALKPYGYSVILCRNCNRTYGPGLVSKNSYPPPLDEINLHDGVNTRINSQVDFGVTSSAILSAAYYKSLAGGGPYKNLRLIAKIEDPFYFLVAVKKESGIKDFKQIKEQKLPVRIAGNDENMMAILKYYGISPDDIKSWGGKMDVSAGDAINGDFDILSGFLASPAMNPESHEWTIISQKYDLYFFQLPDDLIQTIKDQNVDAELVSAHNSLLKGVNRRIKTVGRSGEAFFIRDDAPDQAAYDLAKAIDENHGALKWFIRIYTYDTRTVFQNFGVPLHPGAEEYYREVGYLKE
jgi:TRAP-type uncharacterized transport system substrate-binding protein